MLALISIIGSFLLVCLSTSKQTAIPRSRLEAAYNDLTAGSFEKPFSELEKEVKREEQAQNNLSEHLSPAPERGASEELEQDVSFQRASGSPMEASPADQPPQMDVTAQAPAGSLSKASSLPRKRQLYTVARLVVDPDSQASSQYSSSQERETEARTEEPPQEAVTPSKKDPQNPVTGDEVAVPIRKHTRKSTRQSTRLTYF